MIVAAFRDEHALADALAGLRADGIQPVETYTPAPLEGEDTSSPLPVVVLVAGLLAAAASFALQTYSSVWAYPLIIGGRPALSWPSFIPTVFENGVLAAVAAGFVGFMAINRMPRLYEPVDEADAMRRASSDRWCLAVQTEDAAVLDRARGLLLRHGALGVEQVAG